MSKGIKLEDWVYVELEELREKDETRSEVVERLLKFHKVITTVLVDPSLNRN